MTQEEKQLLVKDLYARLPYGVKGIITYDESNTAFTVEGIDNNVIHLSDAEECYVEDFKPYLRPMSSMTEEEIKYKLSTFFRVINTKIEGVGYIPTLNSTSAIEYIDWLNKHHFDYRGLIEKGLALEAPKGMYN